VDPLLRTAPPVLTWLSDAPGNSAALQLAVKVALAIASVLIPATAMGGTLPVLAQFVAPRGESLGVRSGGLYAVNMFGACAGALAVPAVLLPAIGATGALGAAITINFLVATAALLLDRSNEPANLEPSPPVQGNRPSRETLILAAVSGGITLALEALASRAVALIHENSVYSFATVVAVLLAGLASGAAAARRALRRRVAPRALASIGWAGAGVWMVLLPALFVRITGLDYVTSARLLAHEAHLAPTAGLWTAVSLLGACSIIAAAFAARIRSRKQSSTALPRRSSTSSRGLRSGEGTSAPDRPRSR
jgi:hypothetical protein